MIKSKLVSVEKWEVAGELLYQEKAAYDKECITLIREWLARAGSIYSIKDDVLVDIMVNGAAYVTHAGETTIKRVSSLEGYIIQVSHREFINKIEDIDYE